MDLLVVKVSIRQCFVFATRHTFHDTLPVRETEDCIVVACFFLTACAHSDVADTRLG